MPTTPNAIFIAQLNSIRSLKDNWDGYGAPVPSAAAFANAERLLKQINPSRLIPLKVSPDVTGGIGITFKGPKRKVYVECSNLETVHYLMFDGSSEPKVRKVEPSEGGYALLLTLIEQYLEMMCNEEGT